MPLLTHGGPGRAGGGEEMGGKRGVLHYLQRTAIQGHPSTITAITKQFQVGASMPEANPHVFRKHFEELEIGETVFTHKHTVSDADIVNFANVSGDNFYAHMDATSLEGTIFERRVAHGYFVLSKAEMLAVTEWNEACFIQLSKVFVQINLYILLSFEPKVDVLEPKVAVLEPKVSGSS